MIIITKSGNQHPAQDLQTINYSFKDLILFFKSMKRSLARLAITVFGAMAMGSGPALAQTTVPGVNLTTYDIGPNLRVNVFNPVNSPWGTQKPVLLFIPGGGNLVADPEQVRPFCEYYAQFGFITVSTSYRVVPPYPRPAGFDPNDPQFGVWPAQLEDVRKVVWTLRQFAPQIQANPNRIAAIGASAGGTLAAHLGLVDVKDPTGVYSSKVQRVVSMSGPWDFKDVLEKFRLSLTFGLPNPYPDTNSLGIVMMMFGGTPETLAANTNPSLDQAWAASPQSLIASNAGTMAKTLLLHGTQDTLVPSFQATKACQAINNVSAGKCTVLLYNIGHTVTLDYLNPLNQFLAQWMAEP